MNYVCRADQWVLTYDERILCAVHKTRICYLWFQTVSSAVVLDYDCERAMKGRESFCCAGKTTKYRTLVILFKSAIAETTRWKKYEYCGKFERRTRSTCLQTFWDECMAWPVGSLC